MKRVILFLLFLWVYNGYSQEPIYTQMKSNYQFRGIRTDSLFLLPKYSDTLNANGSIHGSVIRVGNTIFLRDTLLKKWVSVQGVSTDTISLSNRINSKADTSLLNGVVYFSDTLTYIATKSDLPPPVDTTSLSNRIDLRVKYSDTAAMLSPYLTGIDTLSLSSRINNKVDSITKVSDSVRYWKNGSPYYAFTDASGGQNGRWGNDTATIVLAKVRNSTATTMARGTVVMLKGATGDVASVIRANNKADSTSARTIGLVKDPIAAGDTGWVVTQGQASKLNLGSFSEGDVLYLDSLDGQLTKTKPYAPYHQVFIGIVERANNGNGLLYTKPQNGYELDEIHDVQITNPINNQVLVYSDTQDLWKNRNVYSIVDTTSLSNRINQKQDLLSNPVTGTGTSGSLVKFNGTSSITNAVDGVDYLSQDLPMQIFPLLGSTATKAYNFVCPYPNNIVQNVGLGNNMYHNLIYIPKQSTITGVRWYQSITGNYTANASLYNGWALYTINFSTGALTLVDSSANDGNLWKGTANTYQSKPFVVPYSAARGFYVLACFYANSAQTTAPQIGGGVQFSTSAPKVFDFTVPNIKLGSTSSTNTYSTAPSVLSGMGQAIQGNIAMFLY